jgi:hypothetical protein
MRIHAFLKDEPYRKGVSIGMASSHQRGRAGKENCRIRQGILGDSNNNKKASKQETLAICNINFSDLTKSNDINILHILDDIFDDFYSISKNPFFLFFNGYKM